MTENVQLALLIFLIVILYVISSRWRTGDNTQRSLRTSFWIGLAAALALLVLLALSRLRR
jgi:hypothetical protein